MHGLGEPPVLPNLLIDQNIEDIGPQTLPDEGIIRQELLFFHKLNKNAIDTIVPDDLLAPFSIKGML